jgi:hypothetical protein
MTLAPSNKRVTSITSISTSHLRSHGLPGVTDASKHHHRHYFTALTLMMVQMEASETLGSN